MYGKVMSISDKMMWRYYELLTDVQVAEIEKMKREAHPMQAKKDLARRIVADFHSAEAAAKAGEDWAKQFQKDEVPEDVEEVHVQLAEVEYSPGEERGLPRGIADPWGTTQVFIDLAKLLVRCGLAESKSDAGRKLKQGSVKVDNAVEAAPHRAFPKSVQPLTLVLRLGKKMRKVVVRP